MRPRKQQRTLPPCMYWRHGSYYYVKRNKWRRLGADLQAALHEYARLTASPAATMPVLIDRTWPHITNGLADTSITQYRKAADRLKYILAEFAPNQLKARDVAAIRDHYRDRPHTGNATLSFLRQVMSYAVDWQIIDSNPCIGVRRLRVQARDRYLTDDEYQAIYHHASEALRPIMAVCYYTGQRISDVLRIRLEDVTDEGVVFRQGKTGQRVIVRMSAGLRQAIDDAQSLPRKPDRETLFATLRGSRPYAYTTVRDMYAAAAKRAGVENTGLHDLRAKALTDAKNQGLDAQALGGHSTEAMTNRYIRARDTIVAYPPSFRQSIDSDPKDGSK